MPADANANAPGGPMPLFPIAEITMPDVNLALNVLMLLVLVAGAPTLVRSARLKARLEEKDAAIETDRQTIQSLRDLDAERSRELVAAGAALAETRGECEGWKGRYEEQSKYTAPEAFQTIETLISAFAEQSVHRHDEVMASLHSIAVLVGDRRTGSRRNDP